MKYWFVIRNVSLVVIFAAVLSGTTVAAARYMENLDRGVVAVRTSSSQVYVGWRMLGTEWGKNIGYHVYRNGIKITSSPITASTNYVHTISTDGSYSVSAVIDGLEQAASQPVSVWGSFCRSITLATVSGSYTPNDAGVGDLDGDGQYEIVLKRLSTDISQTSTTFHLIEAYRLDGTFLWRINLGPNNLYAPEEINPIVYDFDGDGHAEVALRTCEGNIDGAGVQIGDMDSDGKTDYRSSIATPGGGQWFMTEGPEFLSLFDGQTGREIARTAYIERDPISQWGGSGLGQNAHRADKCMMTPAYLDGQRPSLVICRGIYDRIKMEAWNFRGGSLFKIWSFDTANWSGYAGQGNHNLSVGDVDNDGKDEIVYGSMCVDDNGTGLYSTGLGHGDAMHMSKMIPGSLGLQVLAVHENSGTGTTLRDAGTGQILWQQTAAGDTGRGCAAHIDSRYPGYQMWSVASGGTYNATDKSLISANIPNYGNFLVWWDGDLQREILDAVGNDNNPIINKWGGDGAYRLLSLYSVPSSYSTGSNNGSKANPCLSGDILGDWREEMIYRSSDNTQLRIFTTTDVTNSRFYTLMHDSQYRTAIAWQCNMYNQPPHPSFYIGAGMSTLPTPNIKMVDDTSGTVLCQRWTGITGTAVSDLTSNINYPDNPSGQEYLTSLEGPANWNDNYGTRVRGYIIPPQTGSYTFWIASDDSSQLWLSSDAQPVHAAIIASVSGYTSPYQWNKFTSQQSASMSLIAGHKYYIEILHKDGTGNDHWAVAWQGPSLTQQIVSGAYLSPWTGPKTGDINPDGFVNAADLQQFVQSWLDMDCTMSLERDLTGDCVIDYRDFAVFSGNWSVDLGLQAWWPMNEASGTTVSEVISGFTGTLYNSTGVWTAGKLGNGLTFDGTDDYVNVPGYKGITGTASRTCSAWIKTSELNAGEILSWGSDSPGGKWYIVLSNGTIRVFVYSGNVIGTARVDDGDWHHVAVVLEDDGSPNANEIKLYVDGVEDSISSSVPYGVDTGTSYDVKIGTWDGLNGGHYKGQMDEVRIYDRALTAAEITALAQ